MARRIDIELTSARDDGTWTWRAAGALKPRGVLDAQMLYAGAKVGDVVRAEADFEMDGITILSVLTPKPKKAEPERLEIIGPPRTEPVGVTSSLVSRQDRPRDRDRDRPRDRDRDRPRGDRPDRSQRPGGPASTGDRAARPRPAGQREPAEGAAPGREGGGRPPGAGRPPGPGRPSGEGRPAGDGPRRTRSASERPERRTPEPKPAAPPKPKPKRLNPANVFRAALLDTLPVEQRPIAEQVLRGGIPAVRQWVEADNERARAEGRAEASADALLVLAEGLLPRIKAAEWRDRAEAASKAVDEIGLRDLRAVVAGAEAVARDDEARTLASQLRENLERRVAAELDEWLGGIAEALGEGRVVRALRLSAHPPDPATRLPAELAGRLAEAATAAMSPETLPDRWATLLDAVSASPVRRSVKPVGLPPEPGPALLQAAQQAAGRIPALAALLGIDMPPPPGPARSRGAGDTRGQRPGRPAPRSGPPRVPPPPTRVPPPPPVAETQPIVPDVAPATDEAPAEAAAPGVATGPTQPQPPDTAPAAAAPAPAPEADAQAPVAVAPPEPAQAPVTDEAPAEAPAAAAESAIVDDPGPVTAEPAPEADAQAPAAVAPPEPAQAHDTAPAPAEAPAAAADPAQAHDTAPAPAEPEPAQAEAPDAAPPAGETPVTAETDPPAPEPEPAPAPAARHESATETDSFPPIDPEADMPDSPAEVVAQIALAEGDGPAR